MTEEQANEIATQLTLGVLANPKHFFAMHAKPVPTDVGKEVAALWQATRAGLLSAPPLPQP